MTRTLILSQIALFAVLLVHLPAAAEPLKATYDQTENTISVMRADGGEARRALRKLVRDLHPDRFGESAPEALRQASGEIVSALVEAEARIASGASD